MSQRPEGLTKRADSRVHVAGILILAVWAESNVTGNRKSAFCTDSFREKNGLFIVLIDQVLVFLEAILPTSHANRVWIPMGV